MYTQWMHTVFELLSELLASAEVETSKTPVPPMPRLSTEP